MRPRWLAAAAIAFAVGCASQSPVASDGAWRLLGTGDISNQVDFRVIVVDPPRTFRTLRLMVLGSPIRIYDVRVELDEGDHLDVATGAVVPPGDEGPTIEVPNGRKVQRVVVRYEKATLFHSPASIVLYGRD
jgi:hypothetical protein